MKNIIEISKHGLRFNEGLEYIGTFIKGKSKNINVADHYRILTKGILTDKERILMLDGRKNFFGRKMSYSINYIEEEYFRYITPDHIKNKNYNYYRLGFDPSTVDEFLTVYIKSDPMVIIGNYMHNFVSQISNYTWTYKFNGKTY